VIVGRGAHDDVAFGDGLARTATDKNATYILAQTRQV
jgi:hypothetical protein